MPRQWWQHSGDILKLTLKLPSAPSKLWELGLATKSPEQRSECSALNHYEEMATNNWTSKCNVSMATSPCNIIKSSVWTHLKWKMHLCCAFFCILMMCHVLVLSLWCTKSKVYNKGDVVWLFCCWVFFIILLVLMPHWVFCKSCLETYFLLSKSSHSFKKVKKKNQSVKNLAPSLQTNGDLAKCYTQIHVKCYTGFSPRAFMQTSFVILLI